MEYECTQDEVLDNIVLHHYGKNSLEGPAMEYVLAFNQNLAQQGTHLKLGTILTLPKLPDEILKQAQSKTIILFE